LRKRLQKHLSSVLSPEDLASIYNSYDIIGDIAIFRLPQASLKNAKDIARAIMTVHKNVKTTLAQVSPVAGDFRLRHLLHVAGKNRTTTVHKESGCSFAVDVESCYFSPRLLHERIRIASLVQPNEVVVNMFAGVGCFSIIIAKHAQAEKVFSIDMNPVAVDFMEENIRRNRVYGKVVTLLGDAKTIIEARLQHCADRVLMPLPEKSFAYLPSALSALKPSGGWIHVHAFEHAIKTENLTEKIRQKVMETLAASGVIFEIPYVHVVRSTGPNWLQLVADVHVK
jgi:tRNA (guanine37-N1)-methyltransferase